MGDWVVEGGVAALRVVPAFDEFEDRHPGFDLRLEPVTVEELALERGEEVLTEGG